MNNAESDKYFLAQAIEMAAQGMRNNEGGPFGAVIVKDGEIIGRGNNRVTSTNDPTAHAEVVAIRDACKNINTFQLTGCTLYTSCEPCPMCLAAIYWARPDRVVYGCSKEDAAAIEFDDAFIYSEIQLAIGDRKMLMQQLNRDEAKTVFDEWAAKSDKTSY